MTKPLNSPIKKSISTGVQSVDFISVQPGRNSHTQSEVVEEAHACLTVNGIDLAHFMCSPKDLDQLAVGFLYNEGIIDHFREIKTLHLSKNNCIDIWLGKDFEPPKTKIITAGCGGGVTFDDLSKTHAPINSDIRISTDKLARLMKQVHIGAELYQRARGIHTAALSNESEILFQVEDIGRHNCVDKLAGITLQNDFEAEDHILFTSGRVSSEMLNKARRMGIPIVCSRTSPTSLSVALAKEWNITLVGYLRQNRMRIYATPERLLDDK